MSCRSLVVLSLTLAEKVLFYSMISMFIMISIWTGESNNSRRTVDEVDSYASLGISLYRGIQAYALIAKPPMAVNYYHDVTQWDNFSFGLFVILLTWHADALMVSSLNFKNAGSNYELTG